jgi:hypothetical protein
MIRNTHIIEEWKPVDNFVAALLPRELHRELQNKMMPKSKMKALSSTVTKVFKPGFDAKADTLAYITEVNIFYK